MFKKPFLWFAYAIISAACLAFTYLNFDEALPFLSLDLRMDREDALQAAAETARRYDLGPLDYQQAALFESESLLQNYVELEAGGATAFQELLTGQTYSPFTWRVRHYKTGEANETTIYFTPAGELFGFSENVPEERPGVNLPPDSARQIVESLAESDFGIDWSEYDLVENGRDTKKSGRVDHTLVYERQSYKIGETTLRLRFRVSGNKVTGLRQFVKVPEAFSLRYAEMRSANRTIGSVSFMAAAVLYLLGGSILAIFLLLRQGWVIWRKPVLWAGFIALVQLLSDLNSWPLSWLTYDTALSKSAFVMAQLVSVLGKFLFMGSIMAVSFIIAESLTRKAFPEHLQFWKLWRKEVAASPAVLGQTLGGFLLIPVFLAFSIGFSAFAANTLGWWRPSGALLQPNMIATYAPWLSVIATSLQAGFFEECLFRAVPLAGAAILGQRFGRQPIWIGVGVIIQAIIFGAAHADYPNQPAYARLVELILPSILFACVYLRFGLLPAILAHFGFDVAFLSIPLFVSEVQGAWLDQLCLVIVTLSPVVIVAFARLAAGKWLPVKSQYLNKNWHPAVLPEKTDTKPMTRLKSIALPRAIGNHMIWLPGLLGLLFWYDLTDFQNYASKLDISRSEAEAAAEAALTARGLELEESWQAMSIINVPNDLDDSFVWQTAGKDIYKSLMGNYLSPPRWVVRFAKFTGEVPARAEEYQVFIGNQGQVLRVRHQLPEAMSGEALTAVSARQIADSALVALYGLVPGKLKEVSVVPRNLSNRTDWILTYADTTIQGLREGQGRVSIAIAGNELVDAYRFVYAPEAWRRAVRSKGVTQEIIKILCSMVILLMVIAGVVGSIISWSRKRFHTKTFFVFLNLMFWPSVIANINNWPIRKANFSAIEPLGNQIITGISKDALLVLMACACVALIAGFVISWKEQDRTCALSSAVPSAFSLGALAAGLLAILSGIVPSQAPQWAEYAAAGGLLPVVGLAIKPLNQFISAALFLLLIYTAVDHLTEGWQVKRPAGSAVLILAGMVLFGVTPMPDLYSWLLGGAVFGIFMLLAYHFVIRFQLAIIPMALAVFSSMIESKRAILGGYPTAISGSLLAIILMLVIAGYWYRALRKRTSA